MRKNGRSFQLHCRRGHSREGLDFAVSDGGKGLLVILSTVYPRINVQRCLSTQDKKHCRQSEKERAEEGKGRFIKDNNKHKCRREKARESKKKDKAFEGVQ